MSLSYKDENAINVIGQNQKLCRQSSMQQNLLHISRPSEQQ